ncbi:hypothetical protein [Tautonia plasticadhaerens]|uniref:Uncharacterized protein n=1 Tax=Tautonia plasticadhaerens TaxID=2527974 RepID=A0A518HD63_9BACT|nr:hypothetical protein [Tautonia plasticadhaerens]QDV38797.1 hypothetical protein ElP_67540 [Tautonia plasticadhaerens]
MSRLFRAMAGPSLGLILILFGAVAGCGGEGEQDGDLGGAGMPTAEPGQTEIPAPGPGPAEAGGDAEIPVSEAPEEPGAGS